MVHNRHGGRFCHRLRGRNMADIIAEALQHHLKIIDMCGDEFPKIKRYSEQSIQALEKMEAVDFEKVKAWDRVIMRANNG